MAWMITATVFLSVLIAALCFNIDPVAWRILRHTDQSSFGYQIVQRSSGLLVSAPLERNSPTERGQIYRCDTTNCNPLSVPVPEYATNMSLGLTMSRDPFTQKTLVCGPTIPKDCKGITMYYGACFEILSNNAVRGPVPSSPKECPSQADIAFLLDGSGSVIPQDFDEMKLFVRKMITAFEGKDTKFAIAQFSDRFNIHTYLKTFNTKTLEQKMTQIKQLGGYTFTPTSIHRVVNDIFIERRGARTGATKILIVITDGLSNDHTTPWATAINAADQKKIVRFAIGVGSAFSSFDAKLELNRIASMPSADHVFAVESFVALQKIEQSLQAKIFSIEGSQSSGENLKRELSQSGFSAVYSPQIQMSVVGANDWTGGFDRYSTSYQLTNSYEPTSLEKDSYLGYSMAVAITGQGILTIAGAPRYKHSGAVMAVRENNHPQKIDPFPWQSGQYFGAEVCAMNLDRDAYTDLILISAPMYVDDDREGRVYVCRLSGLQVDCHFDAAPLVLRGAASSAGRFGSSLAVVPDLNTDDVNDLVVGAPLEDDRKGSIYIFHGMRGVRGINPVYSQRITGSEVQSGLKFFGISISKSSFDQSGDSLVDLAVGSEGRVVLLRSKPIVMVETSVTYSPSQVSTQDSKDCSVPINNRATVCFTMSKHSEVDTAQARIGFTLTLDANRKIPNNRAFIREKVRDVTESIQLDLTRRVCRTIDFFVEACPVDILNEIPNQLSFTFEGLRMNADLSPSLAQQAQRTSVYPLQFENYCGKDENCVDNLQVDLNFTGSSLVKVGIDDVTDVTVSVRNQGENSYNTHVILTYPAGLSFRKITVLHGRIECNSRDSEDGSSRGKTDCSINQPILRSNTLAVVIISYGIPTESQLKNQIVFTANATSGNVEHSKESRLYQMKTIDVKYGIFATIESNHFYNNFSFGQNDLQKPVQQLIQVINDFRPVNYTVIINIPVKLEGKDIWVDSTQFQIPDCHRGKDTGPKGTDFLAQIRKNKTVDCSVASCAVFKCRAFLPRQQRKEYIISANLSSGWIEQIGLESAKFILTSTATLDYDRRQYIFQSADSSPPVRKVEMEVEVYLERQFLKEIVGGSLGGLLLLALITAGLYKAGFFKSKLNTMMDESAGEAGSPAGDAPPPE